LRPYTLAAAVPHSSCTFAAAVPHSSSLAATTAAGTAAAAAAAAVVTTAVTAATTAAGTAAAAAAAVTTAVTAATTTAGTAAAAAAAVTTAVTAATTTAGTAAAAATAACAAATAACAAATAACATPAATASMGPDWIRQDYRDRERQQEDKAGFHSILGGMNLTIYQLSASRLKAGFTFFAPSIRLTLTVISTAFNLASSSPFFSAILAERGIHVPVQQMPHEISFLEAILTRNLNCRERLRDVSARPSAKRTELIKCLGIPDKIMLPARFGIPLSRQNICLQVCTGIIFFGQRPSVLLFRPST
jgi:hypothetical protein